MQYITVNLAIPEDLKPLYNQMTGENNDAHFATVCVTFILRRIAEGLPTQPKLETALEREWAIRSSLKQDLGRLLLAVQTELAHSAAINAAAHRRRQIAAKSEGNK